MRSPSPYACCLSVCLSVCSELGWESKLPSASTQPSICLCVRKVDMANGPLSEQSRRSKGCRQTRLPLFWSTSSGIRQLLSVDATDHLTFLSLYLLTVVSLGISLALHSTAASVLLHGWTATRTAVFDIARSRHSIRHQSNSSLFLLEASACPGTVIAAITAITTTIAKILPEARSMEKSQCKGRQWGFLATNIDNAPKCVANCRQKFVEGLLPHDETFKSVCEHLSDNGGLRGANEDLWELYCCDSQLCGVDNLKRGGNDRKVPHRCKYRQWLVFG